MLSVQKINPFYSCKRRKQCTSTSDVIAMQNKKNSQTWNNENRNPFQLIKAARLLFSELFIHASSSSMP